jgi:hypothetical protein
LRQHQRGLVDRSRQDGREKGYEEGVGEEILLWRYTLFVYIKTIAYGLESEEGYAYRDGPVESQKPDVPTYEGKAVSKGFIDEIEVFEDE